MLLLVMGVLYSGIRQKKGIPAEPPKAKMEAENGLLENEIPFFLKPSFSGSMLVFGCVHRYTLEDSQVSFRSETS